MKINHIELNHFRNYIDCCIDFHPYTNLILGKNAQGKTNLLEAIYILAMSKSFKTHEIKELIQFDHDFAKLKGEAISNNRDLNLEIVVSKLGKKAVINQKEIKKSSEYVGYLNVVLFVPEDLMLIKGSPKLRRNLIDTEISKISPIYMYNLNKYNQLLKERNTYLKNIKKPDAYLEVLTEQISKLQVSLIQKRIEFVELLNDISSTMYDYISSHEQTLSIEYKYSYEELSYEYILNQYIKEYDRDIKYAFTNSGIHKDDLVFYLDNKNADHFASQGQQRSIVLSLKIALLELVKKEIGEYPILLLDDVLSELDSLRQTRLLNLIGNKVQTFITSTSVEGIEHEVIKSSNRIEIVNGKVG